MEWGRIYKRREHNRKSQLHKRMSWRTVWQVVQAFAAHQITAESACRTLEVSPARLYALRQRYRQAADPAQVTVEWLYQRSSSSRLPEPLQGFLREELRYVKSESEFLKGHFNFAFLAQQCQKRFGKRFHRNTLRRWAIRQGLYDPKTDSTAKAYVRFEKGAIGALYQHDSSHHGWLPYTRRNDVLILTKDDHSRKIVGGLLVPQDTAWHHLCVVRDTLERTGCPLAYYCDNHSIFRPPQTDQSPKTEPYTQFSRALASIGVTVKFTAKAHPQAKGKIEKSFDYFQRRVPYLCERYHITNLTQANKILQEEIAFYNERYIHAETQEIPEKRWQRALQEGRSFLQAIPARLSLDIVFALHYPRVVKSDGTISFAGRLWPIPKAPRYCTVTVVLRPPASPRRPHTEISVLHKGSTLAHFVLPKGHAPLSAPPKAADLIP